MTPRSLGGIACVNHPGRDAIGLCVRCRARVCGECTTKVDGINHCVRCLATLAGPRRETEAAATRSSSFVSALWLSTGAAALTLATWTLLELGALW